MNRYQENEETNQEPLLEREECGSTISMKDSIEEEKRECLYSPNQSKVICTSNEFLFFPFIFSFLTSKNKKIKISVFLFILKDYYSFLLNVIN